MKDGKEDVNVCDCFNIINEDEFIENYYADMNRSPFMGEVEIN
jgi:hypothetical protein